MTAAYLFKPNLPNSPPALRSFTVISLGFFGHLLLGAGDRRRSVTVLPSIRRDSPPSGVAPFALTVVGGARVLGGRKWCALNQWPYDRCMRRGPVQGVSKMKRIALGALSCPWRDSVAS